MLKSFLIVGLGSFIGGGFRFLLSKFIQNFIEYSFPLGTFVVNILGCFIIGILYALFERGNLMNTELRLFLTVGFCGGFTTFSTFINENFQFLKDSNYLYFLIYILLSVLVGLMAIYLGHFIIKSI